MKIHSFSLGRLCAAILFAAAGSACSGGNNPAPATPVATKATSATAAPAPADLLPQLRAEIGSAACDASAQCKTVAVGQKACGGPETYLPWSTKSSDGAKVQQLANAYRAQRKSENMASGMVSNCSAVMDPGASCSAGQCVSGGANAAI